MKPEDRRHEIKQILTEATSWCKTEPLDLANLTVRVKLVYREWSLGGASSYIKSEKAWALSVMPIALKPSPIKIQPWVSSL